MITTSKSCLLYVIIACSLVESCNNQNANTVNKSEVKLQHSEIENIVTITRLESKPFKVQLISNGKLSASDKAVLYFEQTGLLKRINVKNGQYIKQGAIIAELDSKALKLHHDAALLAMKKAELDLYDAIVGQGFVGRDTASVPIEILNVAKIRSGYLLAHNNLTKAEYDLSGTYLRAPFAGRIADMTLMNSDMIRIGEPFCTLIGDSQLNVEFSIMESDYSFIAPGLSVRVIPFGRQEKSLNGRITSINPSVGKNGLITVCANIRNDGTLLDGMNVKVFIEKSIGNRLVVPRSAVVIRDNLDVLFRYHEGKADWVYVNILSANSESFAVEANIDRGASLNVGDSIIVSGNLNLADGSQVKLNE